MNQKNTSTVNTLFIHILGAAIWDRPIDANLFKGIDADTWMGITDMAKRQTVSALIADKILSLPTECLPSKTMQLNLIAIIQQTEARNLKMIDVLSELKQEYDEDSFPFCLLKGLSVGVNYPKPLLRNAGDIDLFLYRKGDYERSKEWLNTKGYNIVDKHYMNLNYGFNKSGVYIENHRRISYFNNKKYNDRFKKQEDKLVDTNSFNTLQIGSITVKQLPLEFNSFFIFQHLFRHFSHSGVGFRQVCDWLLYLSKNINKIDSSSFIAQANKYAMLYPMQVFAYAAIKHLAASKDIFPFPIIKEDKYADLIIEDILFNGNFGFYRPDKKRPKNKLLGMWFSYKTTIQRSIKFGAISPTHIKKLPCEKLFNRLIFEFK